MLPETPQTLNIVLRPAEEKDGLTMAEVEGLAFDPDEFTVLAFGPERHSPQK